MKAILQGRVVETAVDQGTGALKSVRIDSNCGMIQIFKPDAWLDIEPHLLGEPVTVTIEVRHD